MKPQHLAQVKGMIAETDKALTMKRRELTAAKAHLEETTRRTDALEEDVRKLSNTATWLSQCVNEWESKDITPMKLPSGPHLLTEGGELVG